MSLVRLYIECKRRFTYEGGNLFYRDFDGGTFQPTVGEVVGSLNNKWLLVCWDTQQKVLGAQINILNAP